jgi:membrane associated rhomboid family serine protease
LRIRYNAPVILTFTLLATAVVVVALFLAKELINIFREDDISQFAHILGGLCGSLFGFLFTRRGRTA